MHTLCCKLPDADLYLVSASRSNNAAQHQRETYIPLIGCQGTLLCRKVRTIMVHTFGEIWPCRAKRANRSRMKKR